MIRTNPLINFLLAVAFISGAENILAQGKVHLPAAKVQETAKQKPKLIVGIVVDQMRYDYLFRFKSHYTEGGFKRLMSEGFLFENANYNYVPTYTAPGHACIYTGTTPSHNGIIANDWFDRLLGKTINCVGDSTVSPVGTTSISGKMSPKNLLTTTVTDELRLASNYQSKVIGIALKDRGAILPAGHSPTGAYWHDPYSGNWITSSYYMSSLPQWVQDFNSRKLIDSLLSSPWTPLLPPDAYTESTSDDTPYEGLFAGETKPVFPHNLPEIKKADEELIRRTPFGNTFTELFAKASIEGEGLGKGRQTDFLAVSFSSTDYVGHMFGTNAIELEDTYLRLDRDLADLLTYLDNSVGKNNYLLFLTADHGAAANPIYNHDHHFPGADFDSDTVFKALAVYLEHEYGPGNFLSHANAHQVYLDRNLIERQKINAAEMRQKCAQFIKQYEGVAEAATSDEMEQEVSRTGIYSFIQNGYYDTRSSDVLIELKPGWIDWYTKTGTTHGSAYSYDTHVPLIFFGTGIVHGSSNVSVAITDVAPTVAALLNIENPSGNTGKQLKELLK
jgi:predicted AlkP superfamily pyrophosphatase or phosphodiesterase